MSNQNSANLAVNAIGGSAIAILVGWGLYSFFTTEKTSVCEARYLTSSKFALTDEGGTPLSPSELQARIGAREWGVAENGVVEAVDDGPDEHVLSVKLAKGSSSGFRDPENRGGVSFVWTPFDMKNASAACLSYQVFFPTDFDFGNAGSLPGLFFGDDFDAHGAPVKGSGAGTRVGWQKEGGAVVNVHFANADGWQNPPATRATINWPRGRWVTVDQEMILNTPGERDGVVRLWIDGEIAGENKRIGVRSEPGQYFSGVLADVFYGSVFNAQTAPRDAVIKISPLVVRWQPPQADDPGPGNAESEAAGDAPAP